MVPKRVHFSEMNQEVVPALGVKGDMLDMLAASESCCETCRKSVMTRFYGLMHCSVQTSAEREAGDTSSHLSVLYLWR